MQLFIANRIGTGTRADPFRPDVVLADVGGKCGQIQVTANRYLCVAPNATAAPQGTIDLGAFPLERLSGQRLTRLANALGVNSADIANMTLGEVLLARIQNLQPTRNTVDGKLSGAARWKITVSGVDLYDAPVVGGGATDSFTYSNGALPTVSSGVWVTQTGAAQTHNVASNAVANVAGGFNGTRYGTTFPTDHFSQLDCVATSAEIGVMTRMQSADLSGYYAMIHSTGLAELHRVDAGTFNLLDSTTGLTTTTTLRLESIGSNHTAYYGGVSQNTATDATYNSNTSVGIGGDSTTATGDNWVGGGFGSLEQEGFRWRNDDGSETTATWAASQDSDASVALNTNIRLRALVNATGDPNASAYTLYYKLSTDSNYIPVPVGSAPPFPVVETTAETAVTTAGTSHAITLPTGITSTDKVLIFMDIGSTSATLNALTDWTEHLDEAVANGLKILEFTGTGVPSNPTFTSSASTRSASIALRISGADRATAPTLATTATGTSATPDPPSVTPPSTKNYLVVAFFGSAGEEADDDTWVNTPPTNYTPSPPLQKACGTVGTNLGGLIGLAYRQLNTGSAENPGTFSIDVSAAWRAQTILVHPGGAPPIYVATSANVTAGGEATTAQLSAPSGKTTSDFVTGRMWDDENGTDTIDITADDYTEVEWSLQAQSPAVNGNIYQFRVYDGSTPFGTYTVTAQLTIGSAPTAKPPSLRRRPALTYR